MDLVAAAEALPFRNNVFVSIISFEVIEHLENPKRAFHEISRCLKTGGRLLLTTPNYYGLRNFIVQITKLLRIEKILFPGGPLHKHIFRKRELMSYLTEEVFSKFCFLFIQLGIVIPRLVALKLKLHHPLATTLFLEAIRGLRG